MLLRILLATIATAAALSLDEEICDGEQPCEGDLATEMINLRGDYRDRKVSEREIKRAERKKKKEIKRKNKGRKNKKDEVVDDIKWVI